MNGSNSSNEIWHILFLFTSSRGIKKIGNSVGVEKVINYFATKKI